MSYTVSSIQILPDYFQHMPQIVKHFGLMACCCNSSRFAATPTRRALFHPDGWLFFRLSAFTSCLTLTLMRLFLLQLLLLLL